MEYDAQAVERKFKECFVKGVLIRSDGTTKETALYINAVETDDYYVALHCTVWAADFFSSKVVYVDTWKTTSNKYPKFVPTYWNPENGLYYTFDGKVVFVHRKLRRSFQIGLSNHSYNIRLWDSSGSIGEPTNAVGVNILRPRVFEHPDIFTTQLFKRGDALFFNHHRIGIMNNNVIYLNDPDYVHFLPERIRESCLINH